MSFLELAGELLGLVDFDGSEIIHPRKLVFVCGGKASGIANSPASMREALLNYSAGIGNPGEFGNATVLLAEDAMNALANSCFGNLLDLEEYIAAVVDAVLLIVESPGSMCELGAFVKTPEIREKLIVVIPSDFINVPSFITNGAIKFLKQNSVNAPILGFHWTNGAGGARTAEYTLKQMAVDIPAAMTAVHPAHANELFKIERIGHKIYLTLAFCHLLRAAKLIDLKTCFAAAGIAVDEITIKRCLDTLTICKLLKAVTHGKLTYYVAQVDRMPLEIRWKDTAEDRDRNTLRWITRIKQAIEVEEKVRLEIFREHSNA